jgi:hypothetical protein
LVRRACGLGKAPAKGWFLADRSDESSGQAFRTRWEALGGFLCTFCDKSATIRLMRQMNRIASMRWEVRALWYDLKFSQPSKQYDDREKAYEAFDAMVRSDPAWLELYEIEDGKEPKRLRRYELPRMVGKKGQKMI